MKSGLRLNWTKDTEPSPVFYVYEYDNWGNIRSISLNGSLIASYEYDTAGQLIRENNAQIGKTYVWTYDAAGNIQTRTVYSYNATTPTANLTNGTTIYYTYAYEDDDGVWGDPLKYIDDIEIGHDNAGNLVDDGEWIYTWEHGRQLKSMSKSGTTWTYTYDANGMRTKRTTGSTTYQYFYTGSQLKKMTVGSNTLLFQYGTTGMPVGLTYNGVRYYYVTNLQGDVIAILSNNATAVVTYTYDAWGNILTTGGSMASTLGVYNPLRYRGYVYDQETGLYYLQSRYYNPAMGRYICADGDVSTGQGILGHNMFAYCGNNPVNRADPSGRSWIAVLIVVLCCIFLTGCDSQPRQDLAEANSLLGKGADELSALDRKSYNCYGNGIAKQIYADPTGYKPGDSTLKTFEAVKRDLGGDKYVRRLDSIYDPIGEDEFRVALKCGLVDYHFIRQLDDGTWYNKSGNGTGVVIPEEYVINGPYGDGAWWGYTAEQGISLPRYTYETIYFAVRVGWDAE